MSARYQATAQPVTSIAAPRPTACEVYNRPLHFTAPARTSPPFPECTITRPKMNLSLDANHNILVSFGEAA